MPNSTHEIDAVTNDNDAAHSNAPEISKCICSSELEGVKQDITILESRLLSVISQNESDIPSFRVKQKEMEAAIRRQDEVICGLLRTIIS